MCCCNSPTRIWLFFILFLWLLLACARQVFDLIGRLWIPVIFNLLQILSCINGLFAAGQQRLSLLLTLTFSSIISIAYNVVITLWYAGILGDRNKPLLSAGIPYSHSFFLRYTPSCQSHYNLTTSQWIQHTNCIIPYYNIEGFQALIHIIIAFITMLLSIILFCQRRNYNQKKKIKGIYESSNVSARSNNNGKQQQQIMPNLNNAIYGEAEAKANTRELPPPPDSINDISSGYMNSSYEAIGGDNLKTISSKQQQQQRGIRNIKSSDKSSSSRASQRPKSQAQESGSDYSSVTTKSMTNSSMESSSRPPPPPPMIVIPSYRKKRTLVNRSVSPIRQQQQKQKHRISDEGFSEEDEVTRQYSKMRHKSQENPPSNRIQSVAEQRLSQAAMEQQQQQMKSKESPIPATATVKQRAAAIEHQRHDSGEYLEYIRTERKPSILNNNKTSSLISFDPKSNTLLRVHEHINEDEDDDDGNGNGNEEEEWSSIKSEDNNHRYKEVVDCGGGGIKMRAKRTTSQDSVPSIQAPVLSTSHSNLDSGHPSSNSAEQSISPDWSHAGIYHVTQRPAMSPPLPPVVKSSVDKSDAIIGYESAIHDVINPCQGTSSFQYQLPSPPMPIIQSTAFSSHRPQYSQHSQQQPGYYQPHASSHHQSVESIGISLSTAIPLLNSLPSQHTSASSTRFLAQPPPSMPDYAIPTDSNSHYFSPNDYGLKLRSSTSPLLGYEDSKQLFESTTTTQFDSKPSNSITTPTTPIILSNTGLLV